MTGSATNAQMITQQVEMVNNITQTTTLANQRVGNRIVNHTQQLSGKDLESKETSFYDERGVTGLVTQALPSDLITSRHSERAKRSVDRRNQLDVVRRKQGILG